METISTLTDNLSAVGENLYRDVVELLNGSTLRDVNNPSDLIVTIGASYAFSELSIEKKRLQSKLIKDYKHFHAIVLGLLRPYSDTYKMKFQKWEDTLKEVIEQHRLVWYQNTDYAIKAVKCCIDEMISAITNLYDPVEGGIILVPDTNSLIQSPTFQEWQFKEFKKFEILLVPMLLSELDSLKINHRNETVRNKAQSIIRQIKEYRKRGSLLDGVTILDQKISLRTTAFEPVLTEFLPWIDKNSPDDKMLASFFESMKNHPRSSVILVTGDINLQNKAEFARLPFIEPPKLSEN